MRIDYPLLIAPAYETANDESQLTFCAPVLDLGQPARDKLVHNRRWTAIACFRRSIYLRGGNGDIVCLCSPFIDPGPLNVRCALPEATDWRRLDLGAERTAVVERESLRFGSKTIFYFGQAQIWEPPHVDSLGGTTLARLEAILDAAAGRAPDVAPRITCSGPPHRPSGRLRSGSRILASDSGCACSGRHAKRSS
jgi:hypothetical protein